MSRILPMKPARGSRGGQQAMFARAPMSWGELLAVLLVGVLILYVLIAAISPGYVADIGTNKTSGSWIAREGIHSAYQIPTDYPPVLLYFFGAAGWVYQRLADPTFDEQAAMASQFYTLLVKLPGILFHPIVAAVIYRITRQYGAGLAFAAAAAYALNPAVAYDVARLGQTDPVHAAFALLAVAALVHGRPGLAGACIALAALTKPQAWLLLPVVGMTLIFWYGWRGVLRGAVGGAVASFVVVLPWAVTNRLHHAGRFLEALDTKSINSIALTAQAHNLWWVPTLIEWRFITDSEPFVGPIPYRVLGLGMVALLVAAALARLPSLRPRDSLYGIAGAVTVGWFVLTVRAQENHLVMALPFLTVAWVLDRRFGLLLVLTSASLLMNVALHDPLLMGTHAAGPDPGHPLPAWVIVTQVVNVLMNLVACGLAIGLLLGPTLSGSWAQRVAGRPHGTGSGR